MRHPPQRSTSGIRGQALAEMLLVLLALLPLWWLIPMLDKYQQIAHATLLASRYAAWDQAWHPDNDSARAQPVAQRQQTLWARLFAQPWLSIHSSHDPAWANRAPHHPGWRSTDGSPLLQPDGLQVQVTQQALSLPLFETTGLTSPAAIGLPPAELTVASVSMHVANLPSGLSLLQPFDQLQLQTQAQTALMHGSWTLRSPAAVDEHVTRLTPIQGVAGSGIDRTMAGAMPLVELDGVRPPRLQHLPLWRDLVPADRLQEATP